ncbi:type I toxin-antitoxin system Fst family toxin [Bacillus bombysepticus]|jgi:hypothetical protein|nr:type I toxin-antitoxin system Fst family toxin [Lactococcus sp.]MCI8686667.1 type I toxin-antitoxin system Fst family toxin [Lactococcus lactis]
MLITIFVSVVAPIVVGVILELVKDWLKTDISAFNPLFVPLPEGRFFIVINNKKTEGICQPSV